MTARLDSPPTILRALCLAVALAAIALIATAVIGQDDGVASETTPPPAAPEASGPSPGGGGAEAPARPESPPPSPSEGADGAPADGGNAEAAAPSDGAETTSQPEPQPTEDATDALEGLISDRAEEPLETDPTQEELSQAAEAKADTPASTEGQERTDAAMEPARQLSPEEEKAVHRAEAHARSQQLGAERRDTLQSAFEGLTAPIEPDAEDTRTPEEIREAQERTLVRMAQIARVELAACRRELAERRTELNDVTSAQELLEERMDWEPAAVRRGRKLASEARLAVTTLTDNSMEYEQRFNSLLAEHGEAEEKVERYGALMGQAEAYLKSLEAQSRGGTGGDTRLSLARETVSDLEGCLEASEETVSIITDTLSRLSESVDTASDLAVALERAATFASRNSVLRRSTSPFSRAAVRALAADVQSLPGAVASGVRTVPERMATGWDDLSSDGRTLTVASRIALSVLLLLSLALVLRWLRAGLPRWFEAAPERNEGEEGTGAWRARHTYAVLSLSAICVTLLVLAKLWWELRDLRHAVLLLCLLLGYAAYGHLLKLLLHPDSPHRLLLADEAEMGLPFRFGRALGIANLILMPIEVSLAVIGYENVEALHVIYLIHALALLALAAIYVPRVRRMVHSRFLGRIPAVRLLGEADVFLVITLVLFVILSAAGYTRLAVLVFRGVLLSGISFYGVYILGRRTGRWLMKRHPALGEAAAQQTDKPDDTLALRSVGWDLIIILQRLAIAAIGAVLIAFSWGLKEPHVEFAQTLLARNIMEVQGMEISVWALLRAAIVAYVIYLIAKMVRSLIAGSSRLEERYGAGARYAAAHLWFYTAVSVGFVWALLAAGFQWSILTVFAGMAGIGLGFGLQDVVKNFISGLIILVERPMRVGDLIDVEGESGYVDDISLRSTTLRGTDNVHVIIPNSAFVDQTIRNFSIRDRRMRLRVEVGVAYGSDLDLVREAMLKVARAHPDTLEKPDAEVFLTGFGDSSIDFLLMAWIARPHPLVQLRVRSQLMCGIADEFRRLGIEIPFPQRDLNVRSSEPVPVVLLEGGYDLGSYPQDPPQPDENRPDDHAADSGEAS